MDDAEWFRRFRFDLVNPPPSDVQRQDLVAAGWTPLSDANDCGFAQPGTGRRYTETRAWWRLRDLERL